jgi:hypothetical protein
MLKKTLAAVALMLSTASSYAAIVEYDLNGVKFSDGAVATGSFYQDTSNNAVVYYSFDIPSTSSLSRASFRPSGTFDAVSSISRSFGGEGPSSFSVFDDLSDFYFTTFTLNFARAPSNAFSVTGFQNQRPIPDLPATANGFSAQRNIVSGTVVMSNANPNIISGLESSNVRDFRVIAPEPFRGNVPEPTTYALIGIGLLGFLSTRRKRG